jgi:GT2 family glycosyltransferase
MTLRIAAVVVTYNRRDQIGVTLPRLLGEQVDHVIVVDNGSTDGTREWLAGVDDPRLVLLLPGENLGGAGGFEQGMRLAVERFDPDWIVVLDDDARPEPGAMTAFRQLSLEGWDAVAAAVRQPDGQVCDMNRPVLNPFQHRNVFLRTMLGGGRPAFHLDNAAFADSTLRPVDGASFVGLFLSRGAIAKAGYPDGRLFIYAEDGIYTLGLTQAGGRMAFSSEVRFEHDCSTFASARGGFTPVWKTYYYYRNLMFLYRLAAGWLFWPALIIVVPKWVLKGRLQGEEDRGTYYRLLWDAVRDGLLGRRARQCRIEHGR